MKFHGANVETNRLTRIHSQPGNGNEAQCKGNTKLDRARQKVSLEDTMLPKEQLVRECVVASKVGRDGTRERKCVSCG